MNLLRQIGNSIVFLISIQCFSQWSLNTPYQGLIDSLGNLNYLKPIQIIQNESYKTWCEKNHPYYYQQIGAIYLANVHSFDNLYLFEQNSIKLKNTTYKLATPYILQKAKENTILMFNEEHHNPFHRLYLTSLLPKLKKEGYHILTLEMLNYDHNKFTNQHYLLSAKGSYSNEPYFANLVRTALELGFTIKSHEVKNSSDHYEREKQQAQNLNAIVKENPNQKIIVYAGYEHIAEMPPKMHNQYKRMAQLFTELSGVNPFTIDQTKLSKNHPIHTISIPVLNNSPFVPKELKGMYDLVLSYPQDISYLHKKLGKKAYTISFEDIKDKKLIQFYIKKEYENHKDQSIPYEQFLITKNTQKVYLNPTRDYIAIIRDDQYKILSTYILKPQRKNIKFE